MAKKKTAEKETIIQPTLSISKIFVPKNLRHAGWEKNLDDLLKLVQEAGLKQPPGVRAYPDGKLGPNGETHELVFGFRRLEACKRLGYTTIPVTILSSKSSNKDVFVARLVENFGREDLSPLEEAEALKLAIDKLGFTAKDLAAHIGKTAGYVSQRLSLLKMSGPIKEAVQRAEITPTHARELARVTDEREQSKLLERAKRTPMPEFKEQVEAASSKRQTNRGRKAEPKKEKQPSHAEGKIAVEDIRPKGELKKALSDLDVYKKRAVDANDRLQAEFFKGMMRGIGWAGGMVRELLPK